MEQSETYRSKLNQLGQAISDFSGSLEIDFTGRDQKEVDVIKNGQIQKFEITIELLWKVMQRYLYEKLGQNIGGPKLVVKAFYENNIIKDKKLYEIAFEMVETRNKLSHLYDKKYFEEIYPRLKVFSKSMNEIKNILSA